MAPLAPLAGRWHVFIFLDRVKVILGVLNKFYNFKTSITNFF